MTPASIQLSEAMRLGAMAIKPLHGPIFDGPDMCAACAVGTPLYVVMGKSAYVDDDLNQVARLFEHFWPWTTCDVRHPLDHTLDSVIHIIVDLFECCGWSRERIADWIASIEPAPVTEAPQVVAEQEPVR